MTCRITCIHGHVMVGLGHLSYFFLQPLKGGLEMMHYCSDGSPYLSLWHVCRSCRKGLNRHPHLFNKFYHLDRHAHRLLPKGVRSYGPSYFSWRYHVVMPTKGSTPSSKWDVGPSYIQHFICIDDFDEHILCLYTMSSTFDVSSLMNCICCEEEQYLLKKCWVIEMINGLFLKKSRRK
jgi:hypothetical protein